MAGGGGARPLRLICLVVGIAALFGVLGPRLFGDAARRAHSVAALERKFEALRDFALFRSRGDRAVLRGGEGPSPKRKTDSWVPRRQMHGGSPSDN